MASFSVFGVTAPDLTDLNDSDSYALGTVVEIDGIGTVTHARWYFPGTAPSGPVTWRLSDLDTLDLLGSHVFSGTGPGWIEEALAAPIAIPAPRNVLVWIGTPDRYVATTNFFTSGAGSAGITSGPLTAPASANDPEGIGNGRFGGDPDSPPGGTISGGNYFPDLVFEEAAPSGTAAFTLDLALASTGDAPVVPPNEGAAAFVLDLALASAGDAPVVPPNEGAADFPLVFMLSGTGESPDVEPNQGSAAFVLDLALASTGDAPVVPPNEGTAAFGMIFTLVATGDAPAVPPNDGAADFPLAVTVSGTGVTPAVDPNEGSASFVLDLALAGSGSRQSSGSAAFTLILTVAAEGSNGEVGCPVPAYPWTPRAVRSFPGRSCC